MALTDFWGWTADELLAALKAAQKDLASGSSTISASAGDVATQKMITNPARVRIAALQKALYELDPDTYADFQDVGCSTTIAIFQG